MEPHVYYFIGTKKSIKEEKDIQGLNKFGLLLKPYGQTEEQTYGVDYDSLYSRDYSRKEAVIMHCVYL